MRTLCKRFFTTASAKPYSVIFFGSDEFSRFTLSSLMLNGKYSDIIKRMAAVGPSVGKVNSAADYFHRFIKDKKIEKYTFRTNFKPLEKFIKEQEEKHGSPFDLGVIASFPHIIPVKIINMFPKGVLVAHPSLVPDYLGSSPIEHQILNKESKSGITIMEASIVKGDIGKTLLKKELDIEEGDGYMQLAEKCGKTAGEALAEVIDNLEGFRKNAKEEIVTDRNKKAPLIRDKEAIFLWDKLTVDQAVRKQMALIGSNKPGFTKLKRKDQWYYVYFHYLTPIRDETTAYFRKNLAPVDKIAKPGDIHWNRRGEHKILCIRCADGWVSTEYIKVENERTNTIGGFITKQLRNEHYDESGKFVHRFACSENIIKIEHKLDI